MYDPYLAHYGVKGMKWGVRRYQNKDGSLTSEGKKHVSNYKRNQQLRKKKYEETDKLIKSDKRLQRDFGSANQVDDNEYLELVAREYGIDTTSFWNAYKDQRTFYRENRDSIRIGERIVSRYSNRKVR